jgi:copper transport protein
MNKPFQIRSHFHIINTISIIAPLTLILLLLLFLPTIPKSYAHAFVIKSNPSPSQSLTLPPAKVDVYFSEPVDIRYSKLAVLDSNGKQVDDKDIHNINGDQMTLSVTLPSGRLKDGVYTATTKVLSQIDGHVTDNAFVFGVGEAGTSNNLSSAAGANIKEQGAQLYIPDAIARFPALVGQVIVVGASFATLWLWRPISKISWLNDALQETRRAIDRNLILLVVIGSIILIISDFGIIYVQAKSIGVGIGEAITTKFGNIWIARTIDSFILLVISLLIYSTLKKNPRRITSKEELVAIFAMGIATLMTTSLIGHGAATSSKFLPITIDFIHNLAASVWIGGVIYLGFVMVPAIRRKSTSLEEYTKASLMSVIIPRFSVIPVTILGIIVITGPFLLYLLEDNLGLLLASLYGKELIVKLLLASIMIGIGAYNQLIIQRQSLKACLVAATVTSNTKSSTLSTHHNEIDSSSDRRRRREIGVKGIWRKIQHVSNGIKENSSNRSTDSIITKFNKSTKVESIVGILLLVAVAFLVNTGLPESEFQNQLQQQGQLAIQPLSPITVAASTGNNNNTEGFTSTKFLDDGSRIILSINPFTPGNNNFKISFIDSAGNPIGLKSVQMKFTQIEKGIGPIKEDAKQISKGVFSINSAAFSLPGQWEVQVEGVQSSPNSPNLVAVYDDLFVKPSLDQLKFNVREFRIPSSNNNSQPLYPIYDNSRNVIWVGDTVIDSGRIFEFNLNSNKFTEHKINGSRIITVMALDQNNNNQIWYVDPLMKHLGRYDPNTHTNQIYKIPNTDFIVSGIAVDKNDNVWLTSTASNTILRFNTQAQAKNFTAFQLPTANAASLGITTDPESGQIWVTEDIGKLANIDPTKNYKIVEYSPKGKNNTLNDPTALLIDPKTEDIYISEHEGHAVSVFNPILKTFDKRYSSLNPNGLPFGMAMDKYGNLWVAEHIINKIAVIDPRTGQHKEINIPNPSPFVQWITSDSKGNIWLAEQRGNSLALITSVENPFQSNVGISPISNKNNNNSQPSVNMAEPLGLNYADIVGPSLAAGIIVSTLFYTKSVLDLKKSTNYIIQKKPK